MNLRKKSEENEIIFFFANTISLVILITLHTVRKRRELLAPRRVKYGKMFELMYEKIKLIEFIGQLV